MCAGIISACLPTMRPVVITVAAKLGLSRCVPVLRHDVRTGTAASGTSNSNQNTDGDNTRSLQAQSESTYRTESRNAFYRLHDDSETDYSIVMDTAKSGSADHLKLKLGKQFRVSGIDRVGNSSERFDRDGDTDEHSQDTARTATDDIQLQPVRKPTSLG